MTHHIARRWHWLQMVPVTVTAVLTLTACGSLSRLAVERNPHPPAGLDVPAAATSAAAPSFAVGDEAPPTTALHDALIGTAQDPAAVIAVMPATEATGETSPGSERDAGAPAAGADMASDEPTEEAGLLETAQEAVSGAAGSTVSEPAALALALQQPSRNPEDEDFEPYDPWAPFNERMFEFNRQVDRVVLKPVATVYDRVVPDRLQLMLANGFDNLKSIPRMVNSLLQGKFEGALREFGRLAINSTIGIGGLFDMAQQEWGIRRSEEDFGQTLGVWGVGPGPYLVLPLMEPMTVRDGIGRAVDGFLDPLNYLLPFIWERLTVRVGEGVNDRSLNLELYEGFEETVIDLYAAVRHVYLQRRERMVRE